MPTRQITPATVTPLHVIAGAQGVLASLSADPESQLPARVVVTDPSTDLALVKIGAAGQTFTGLIIDARGLGVKPAMAPKVLNEDGKEVYGSAWINRDWAVREGMAGYLKDPLQAQQNPRVTDKPLLVKAIKASGDARVDLVISNADAAMLHGASQNMSFLEKCKVIILVD